MPTIIDSLIVTLGLDANPYRRGARIAAIEQAKLKDSVKKGTTEVGDAIAEVGRQAALLFLGFEGIKGALNFFAGLNVATANLGRFSKNLGESAHEVNTWDSAVELAGGSAKDAEADLLSLSNSITALKATGDVSPLILLFQRMGVALYDAQGRTRKLTDLYKDLGDRLQGYNRADAFNLAKQAGLSESTFNLIRSEGVERERLLALAEQNNTVTEQSTEQAAKLQEEWRGIGQTVKGLALTLLGDVTPAIKSAFEWVQQLFTGIKNTGFLQGVFSLLGGALRVIVDLATLAFKGISELFNLFADTRVGKWLGTVFSKLKDFGSAFVDSADTLAGRGPAQSNTPTVPTAAASTRQIAADRRAARNNPGNLRFAGQLGATNDNGFASFKTLGEGIQAANRQLDLYAQRGVNTIARIVAKWAPPNENDVPAYIAALKKATGKGENDQLSAFDRQRLLQGIFGHEGSNKVSLGAISAILGNPSALDAARFANAQAVPEAPAQGNRSTVTTVDIDTINVNAPNATNAKDIAAELPGALSRKGVVAQADSGMS